MNLQTGYISILLALINIGVSARPTRLVVSDLLGSAKFVGKVVVTNYDGNGLIEFRSLEFKDTVRKASCGQKIRNGFNLSDPFWQDNWTANMPFIGDTVLVIINGYDRCAAFGKRIADNYRLWSPSYTLSVAFFVFEDPVKGISKEKMLDSVGAVKSCRDGCLLPINQLKTLLDKYRNQFDTKLRTINLEEFQGKTVEYIFYDDILRQFNSYIWTDEPPGKLKSLILTYSNDSSLEIIPEIGTEHPAQFNIDRNFDLEKFKKTTVKEIIWLK